MHGNNDVANSGKSGSRTFAFLIFFKKQDIIVFRFKNHKILFFSHIFKRKTFKILLNVSYVHFFVLHLGQRFKIFSQIDKIESQPLNSYNPDIHHVWMLKNQRYHNSKKVLKLLKGQRKWFQVFIRLLHTL